eukprot:148058-Chlamydomonas_euryale.AAC.1
MTPPRHACAGGPPSDSGWDLLEGLGLAPAASGATGVGAAAAHGRAGGANDAAAAGPAMASGAAGGVDLLGLGMDDLLTPATGGGGSRGGGGGGGGLAPSASGRASASYNRPPPTRNGGGGGAASVNTGGGDDDLDSLGGSDGDDGDPFATPSRPKLKISIRPAGEAAPGGAAPKPGSLAALKLAAPP